MAFANGAPDIIASITASDSDDGVYIAVGGLFGACVFANCVVLSYCVLRAKEAVPMPPIEWIRDLGFYIIAGVVILIYGFIGYVNMYMAIGFLFIYIIYFILVLYLNRKDKIQLSVAQEDIQKEEVQEKALKVIENKWKTAKTRISAIRAISSSSMNESMLSANLDSNNVERIDLDNDDNEGRTRGLTLAEIKHIVAEEEDTEKDEIPFGKLPLNEKLLTILNYPLDIVAILCIPPVELEKLKHPLAGLFPITSGLLLIYFNKSKYPSD